MELQEVMKQRSFAIVGDTLNEEKYAYKIKHKMLANGYKIHSVGKELETIDEIPGKLDIIDLCIHPVKGLKLMKACTKPFKSIVIQPGAESEELMAYLDEMGYPYIQGCLLVGLSLFVETE
ncbi:MAG: CoA-binding protein [Eubacteriales bacterium]|nr:CoA-binding protein [Eubacteriales bacterium]